MAESNQKMKPMKKNPAVDPLELSTQRTGSVLEASRFNVHVYKASELKHFGKLFAMVSVWEGTKKIHEKPTEDIEGTDEPVWDTHFDFDRRVDKTQANLIKIKIYEKRLLTKHEVGSVLITINPNKPFKEEGWFAFESSRPGKINVNVDYYPSNDKFIAPSMSRTISTGQLQTEESGENLTLSTASSEFTRFGAAQ